MVEIVDNPFDVGTSFLGIDSRISAKKRRKQRDNQKELDEIKEMDLKAELAKGHTLLSYIEYMPQ